MSGLEKLTSLHFKILALASIGLTMREISERTEADYQVVRSVVNSELGKDILKNMDRELVRDKVSELQEGFKDLLLRKKDLPEQLIEGYVTQPVFDEEGEFAGVTRRRVEPELQLRAFVEVSKLAGLEQQKAAQQNNYFILQGERLAKVKQRAAEAGMLARTSEETVFQELPVAEGNLVDRESDGKDS